MTRRCKQPKRRRGELFVGLEFWEMETDAFQHLSADATRVYLFMRKRYNGANNGCVIFSWRDAMAVLRSGCDRAGKALRELRTKGFVKLRAPGKPGPNIRPAGEWQLTAFECGGQPASKDFVRWRPEQLPTPETGTPRTQNRCGYSDIESDPMPKTPESVPEAGALDAGERTQNRYTCRSTSKGGLPCPRCRLPALQTRTRSKRPNRAPVWHSEWLVCAVCNFTVFDKAHEQTGDEACATARPSSPAAASAGSAGMVWRKPTYIELPKKRAPRNSGSAWPAAERKRLGLTQPEFARCAGIRREYLSTIEQGRRNPSADIRARLEAALRSITSNGRTEP